MKDALKKIGRTALTFACIPFMVMGIAVWGAVMFAKIGIETLIKHGKIFEKQSSSY